MTDTASFGRDLSGRADFWVELGDKRPARILQVTDTQIIDASACRYPGRLTAKAEKLWAPENVGVRMTRYLDAAVEAAKPDLIVHTGDFVYGEFDDSGRMLDLHIALMERYGVPWTVALGNHERESAIGADAICAALERAPHCLFRKGETDGYGNFTVLLRRGGRDAAAAYILDTGYWTETRPHGITEGQRRFVEERAKGLRGLPAFAFFHIPPAAVLRAAERFGSPSEDGPFPLCGEGAFGYWGERVPEEACVDRDGALMRLFAQIGVRGVFVGHFHKVSASVRCGNVRVTFGLKTGEYDSHIKDGMGGTLLSFPAACEEGFSVRHFRLF